MPRSPAPLPDELGSAFAVGDAAAAGVSRARLRARDLEKPFRGVRAIATLAGEADGIRDLDAEEHLRRARAYATRMPPTWFFSHRTAALFWGAALPATADDRIDVGVRPPERLPRGRGVRGHEIAPHLGSVRVLGGLRVASPASAWAQLGGELDVRDLVAVGACFVTPSRGPDGHRVEGTATAQLSELHAAADAGPRTGVARLREALRYIRPGLRSRPEAHLYVALVEAGLPEPALDVEVFDARGVRICITEIAFPRHRVLIEYEGDYHRLSRRAWQRDVRRHEDAREAGWTVVHLTAADLYPSPARAVARVRAALAASARPHP
ncbi:hypothetical protein [Microbacterium telephonicum]|uniref:DUF559 domain-containing protein n=1 Tax=Microbacterium telephonicum TaxID=1714841 RepID=A0A498CBW1_9MICO|nr:hypothetical protein [Microbacterium telephonicum]RLK49691.1 hypothetical protein C7474_1852 [Microbacterium telephonicum]